MSLQQNQLTSAAVPNDRNAEVRPQIFKLDVDSVQEMFDWLVSEDIHSVAKTCTRMQRIAGDYFETNLAAVEYYLDDKTKMTYEGFKEYVQKLRIAELVDDDDYRFIGNHCKSLKQIHFRSLQLNAAKIEYIKPILSKVECLRLWRCNVEGEFYECFLKFLPSLKEISLRAWNQNILIGTSNEWLLKSYPTLDHFEVSTREEIPELRTFFELNPSLKKLSINEAGFLRNINSMLQTKIKVEVLVVDMIEDDETVIRLLKQLHDRGFYKRLHLRIFDARPHIINEISLLRVVEKLCLIWSQESPKLNLSSLTNLKQLDHYNYYPKDDYPIEFEFTAKSLVNLERIFFEFLECELLEPLIRYAVKLKAIKVNFMQGEIPNWAALNRKREQLKGARKITIYIHEDLLIATKYQNNTTDFNMIELKRAESYDWGESVFELEFSIF